jgi:cobalamin biosynthesis protein CobD/CbiB
MALGYLGLAVASKLQKSNEKSRRIGKISIFLQDRLKYISSGVTALCELDEDATSLP